MVCSKCEAKLSKLIVKDTWKAGGPADPKRKTSSSGPIKTTLSSASGGAPASGLRPCRVCKQRTHLAGAFYCQQCAYRNGICAMCGTKVLDTTAYKQSST